MAVASAADQPVTRYSSSKAAKQDPDAASDASSFHSSDASDRREIEILTSVLCAKSEEYRLLFRLPPDEVLIQDFNCALQENILLQGHMYLFIHHICFYSNIFGFETKKVISFKEILCVQKAKTAAIFPNAIEITCDAKKYFFGSFLSRDEAYRLIIDGWAQNAADANASSDRQDVKSESSSQVNHPYPIGSTATQSTNEPSAIERISGADISEECTTLSNGKHDTVSKAPVDINEIEDVNIATSSAPSLWICEDVDAPKIPGHFTLVAEGKFLVRLEDFFSLFVSDNAIGFLESFHKSCGDKDIQITAWHQHEQCGLTRDISFLHPIKAYLGTRFGRCQDVQKLHVYRNRHLIIESSKQISDVPFSDCFKVEGIWDVEQDGNNESTCKVCVYTNVPFSKRIWLKGTIERSTKEECRDIYTLFIKNAHDFLKRNSGKLEENTGQNIDLLPEVARLDGISAEEPSRELHPISAVKSPEIPLDTKNSTQNDAFVQEGLGYFMPLVSSFSEIWASFFSFSWMRKKLPLIFLVSIFVALFLMQASIIVLLTRAPEVRVISHENYMGGPVSHDNIHWLESYLSILKEEMVMLDNRMKNMHIEYEFLKAHMERLKQFNPSHEQ